MFYVSVPPPGTQKFFFWKTFLQHTKSILKKNFVKKTKLENEKFWKVFRSKARILAFNAEHIEEWVGWENKAKNFSTFLSNLLCGFCFQVMRENRRARKMQNRWWTLQENSSMSFLAELFVLKQKNQLNEQKRHVVWKRVNHNYFLAY